MYLILFELEKIEYKQCRKLPYNTDILLVRDRDISLYDKYLLTIKKNCLLVYVRPRQHKTYNALTQQLSLYIMMYQ